MPTRVDYDYDVAKLGSDMVRFASLINELGAPTSRAVNRIIKRAAERAGVNPAAPNRSRAPVPAERPV